MTERTIAERTARLAGLLALELGPDAVSTDPELVRKVSSDWSKMSPILAEKVPAGRYLADLVVRPSTPEEVPVILALAYDARVPVTPRGAGTGNYGQLTPFDGGITLDLRGLDHIAVEGDLVRAGAGAKLTAIDVAGRAAGRDIWMFPSTKGSTIGGFLGGGSAGTGTIARGTTGDGWVESLTVAPMDGSGRSVVVTGDETQAYIHAYGVTGVITEAVVRTDPAREWVAIYAALPTYEALVSVHRSLLDLPVLPRLASGDEPALVATLPADVELDPASYSLRVIAEVSTVSEISRRVGAAGGEVVGVLEDYAATDKLSSQSYNHPIYYWQQAVGEPTCFHLETGGTVLWDDPDAVRAVYGPSTRLHLELMGSQPLAMVVADYESEEQVLAGIPRLEAAGLGVHSPHQWYVDRNVELVLETVKRTDPRGLLNPGKLDTSLARPDTRTTIGAR
ncbi:FAD-binding oxidoreductase [Ruania alkalisoli]|uniref:FAD-binding oxidoreductase n=1 Tax=Ruania alkalisoli TaxID=2779775 RepID=A0A7M1SUJ1_9MICO|nr:FAD-binding oxidoreductase [Ruania alkalisoli]QOR71246.1 FAD-binding oxidoreductase [Ruania alkalisoli]